MNDEAVTSERDLTAEVCGIDVACERGGSIVTSASLSDDGPTLRFTTERLLSCTCRPERFPRAVG